MKLPDYISNSDAKKHYWFILLMTAKDWEIKRAKKNGQLPLFTWSRHPFKEPKPIPPVEKWKPKPNSKARRATSRVEKQQQYLKLLDSA